jgi:uncharacterized protein
MTSPFVIFNGAGSIPAPIINTEQEPPWFQILQGDPPLVYLPRGSQLYAVSASTASALANGESGAVGAFRALAESRREAISPADVLPEWNALSLNVAQSCNLSCDYCYADEGRFGGTSRLMEADIAVATVANFLASAKGGRVTIGFIGGEPFLNRDAIQKAVRCAVRLGADRKLDVRFSVTTNGTLLTQDDIDFLRRYRFAVSISIDGTERTNDTHRRQRNNSGSFERIRRATKPLLDDPGGCRVAARATITRDDLDVLSRLDTLEAMGFSEAGVSPLRSSPIPELALRPEDWPKYLAEMCRAGERERRRLQVGLRFRFSNLHTAVQQIHRGHSLPLPCGSGASYLSANSEGEYFTCHRTIDDRRFHLGGSADGPSDDLRSAFLASRHVDRQEPCRTCWARYLCGGGCHAEVIANGRQGCDFIRGWLEYCVRFHYWVLNHAPHLLREPDK